MYFQLFQGVNAHWYWRLFDEDNNKIAFSSEGYANKTDALARIDIVKLVASKARIEELT